MLQGKRAVIFGAGGSIGAAVASEFAAEGAEVFLAGRTRSNVEAVAHRIGKAGHRAHAAVIDALDDAAVNTYIDGIANLNFLKVPATVSDTAKAAVLLASDRARLLTGTVVNSTGGAALD